MNESLASDASGDSRARPGQPVVRLGARDILTEPLGPDFSDDGLPDPYRRIGRHCMWALVYGQPLTHGEFACTHAGECPSGCQKLPDVPPATPYAPSPAWDAWQAFMRGCHHWTVPTQPIPEPDPGVTLRARGSWNQHTIVSEPLGIQPLAGMRAP